MFKVGDHAKKSKYENIFGKGCTPNWSKKYSVIKKVKTAVSCTYFISGLKVEEFVGTFYQKKIAKNRPNRTENVIRTKGYRLYLKKKDSGYLFNSWINMKHIV